MIFDHQAEADVIGCLTLGGTAALDLLAASDFHSPVLAGAFDAAMALHHAGSAIDVGTLSEECSRRGVKLERSDLLRIQAEVPASANVVSYARIVAERRMLRRAVGLADELRGAAERSDLETVEGLCERALAHLDPPRSQVSPPMTAAEFIAQDFDQRWLIPNLLRPRERWMVTAAEGKGKSLLLLQLAVMVAAGIHPFRVSGIVPARVLVLDLENDPEEVRDRLGVLAASVPDTERLWLEVRPQGLDLRRSADRRWLEGKVAAVKPQLVILGPVYNLIDSDERMRSDSAESALVIARFLSLIRVRYDCALILEAHAPHGDKGDRAGFRPFGSTVWLRWVNAGIGLRSIRHDGPEEFEVVPWKQSRSMGRDWPRWLTRSTTSLWPFEARYA